MKAEVRQRIEQIQRLLTPKAYIRVRNAILPETWCLKQLQEIATISSGNTPNRNNSSYWNGNIPWVTTGELAVGYIQDTIERITTQAVEKCSLVVYPTGTLLMAMYGQGKTRGTVAMLGIDATINQACAAISLKQGDPKYLFYQLQHSYDSIRRLSNTGNQENLNAEIIKTFSVRFAPIAEQRKIAAILTTQDKVIELKEKLLAEKQRQKKHLMQQLLTGKKRLPGFEGEWQKVRLSDALHEINERTTQNNQYDILSVTKNGIVKQAEHFNKQVASEDNTGYKVLRRGNLAFSTMNLWMGSLDILDMYDIGIISPAYKVFKINEQTFHIPFAKQFMKSEAMIRQYNIHSEQGASIVRRNLDLQALMSIRIRIPPITEQSAIAAILSTADREISLLQEAIAAEKAKKKALMQLLLTGIVRVKL